MPSDDAVERERAAVEHVMTALRSASDLQVDYVGSPDEERSMGKYPSGLTVDALIRLSDAGGERTWALDVMNLPWNPLLIPARRAIEDQLRAALEQLAADRQVSLSVVYQPPIGHEDHGTAYMRLLLDYVRRVIDGDEPEPHLSGHPIALDPNTGVDVNPVPDRPGAVELCASLTETAEVRAQLEGGLVPALVKKLAGQLLRAHTLGFPTILAIDQVGPASEVGNNFLASSTNVGQTVSRTVVQYEHRGGAHCLDLALLLTHNSCSPVYGYWPDGPEP